MPHNRFFLNSDFFLNTETFLFDDEAHHLQRVMRKQKGEIVELVNGRNFLAKASIEAFEKKSIRLIVRSIEEKTSSHAIILCQAFPRLSRLEMIIEKGTELGMTEIWLFPGQRREKNTNSLPLKRLETIAIAAMKQCGRLDLPKIILKPPLHEWNYLHCNAYFGEIAETAPFFRNAFQLEKNILFFVGPEAGFTFEEESCLRRLRAIGVRLHSNILRTDTAAITALSIITSYNLEDL